MAGLECLLGRIATRADEAFELQARLTAFKALGPENGGRGEKRKADFLESFLKSRGVRDITRLDAPDSRAEGGARPNIVARIPGNNPGMLWVLGHMDVVPAGDEGLWKTDPWTVVRDEADPDIITGRGVEDNQQAIVSACILADALHESGACPERGLGLILVSDEETGNEYGIRHVLGKMPGLVAPDDIVVVPDSGSPDGTFIEIAEKGILWLRVKVEGRQCHASRPDDGINALAAAAEFIAAVPDVEREFPARDGLFSPSRSTFTPTRHEQGVPNVNTMPGTEIFYVDCRVLPCYTLDEVVSAMRNLAGRVSGRTGARISIEAVMTEPAAPAVPVESPAALAMKRCAEEETGRVCVFGGIGGSTVAVNFRERGIPAVVWSTIFENCHAPNERARLSNAVQDARVFARMLFSK